MAGTAESADPVVEEVDTVGLDDARDFVFTAMRACERFAATLKQLHEQLEASKPEDAWLELIEDHMARGKTFFDQEQGNWNQFSDRVHAYVDLIREEAEIQAIEELRISRDDDGNAETPPRRLSRIASMPKAAKIVHPELQKFKLEKQAKIIGKYGGAPALGGLVLPRAPRTSLKATASPAAREIHYTKMEDKDAPQLAQVFHFKAKKQEEAPSPWQEEVNARKGRAYTENLKAEPKETSPGLMMSSPYAAQLSAALEKRASKLEGEEEQAGLQRKKEAAAAAAAPAVTSELAGKFAKRQSILQEQEAAAKKPAMEEEEEQATSVRWTNSASPYGNELAAALQQRRESVVAAAAPTPEAASESEATSGSVNTPTTPLSFPARRS